MNPLSRLIFFLALLPAWMVGCAPAAPSPTTVPIVAPTETPVPATPTPAVLSTIEKLHWFGTSAILYQGSQNVYFDPITLAGELPTADLILVTHGHSDHWSVKDLLQIIGPQTTLVISPNVTTVYEQAKDQLGIEAKVMKEGETLEVNGVTIEAVPAYDGIHPRQGGGVGYIITIDGQRIYHAGGTGPYPEMAQNECDIAIVPIYRNTTLNEVVSLIPAKEISVVHTSANSSESYAIVLGKDHPDKKFVTIQSGPLEP